MYKRFHILVLIAVFIAVVLLPVIIFRNSSGVKGKGQEETIQQIDRQIITMKKDSLSPEKKFELAYSILKQSIDQSYTPGKAAAYMQIGIYFSNKRKHAQAVRFLFSAGKLFAAMHDTNSMMDVDLAIFASEIYLKDYENALRTCRDGLEMARQHNDLDRTGRFLEVMADIFREQGEAAKALEYYRESMAYYRKAGNIKRVAWTKLSIGGIYLDQKRFPEVLRMYDSLLTLSDTLDATLMGILYTRIAHIYDVNKEYGKSLVYNRRALNVRLKGGLKEMSNSSYINLAGDYLKLGRKDSGLYYMDVGIREASANRHFNLLLNAYKGMYHYYLRNGDAEKAVANFMMMSSMNDSILKERMNTDISVIKASQNLLALKENVRMLQYQGNIQKLFIRNQKVFQILLSAMALALIIAVLIITRINIRHRRSRRRISNTNIMLQHEAAERKILQKKTNEKEEHYRFIAEHSLDLIARISKDYQFTYASPASAELFGYSPEDISNMNLFDLVISGYADSLKEQMQEIANSRKPRSIAFHSRKKGNEPVWVESTFNPVFDQKTGEFREFVSVTRNIQELKKREMGIVEGTKQKENLLREIHHRVKNNFAILVSLINMQKTQIQNEEVKQSLTNLQLRIRTMALVHEMLYRSENFEKISFSDYVRSVASVISATYGRMSVHLEFDLEQVVISIETAIPLGLILNELLSNSYQHAFEENQQGTISVGFKKQAAAGTYALSVSDTGKGLPEGFNLDNSKTMGLRIVDILVKQIEARLLIDQTSGTRFSVIFHIEN